MNQSLTALQRLEAIPPNTKRRRPNKYNAKRVTLDGRKFDSIKESFVYSQLRLREKAGEIRDLECQVPIALLAHDCTSGQGEKVATYKVDFKFYDNQKSCVRYVDAKGVKTAMFNLKARMVKACYGITVETV